MKPRLLLLDEPLASLDRARKLEILPYLARLRDEAKVPMIYVSHQAGEIQKLCSQVVRIEDGRVEAAGGLELLDAERRALTRAMLPPCSAERIVCLTEETVETLYLLGEERRIAGVSGYAVRPPRVRREKPRVSAFISADVPKILALDPDLVLTFSDLQADIAAELIRARRRGACLQPARRRRHFRHDPHARRAGRRERQGGRAGALAGAAARSRRASARRGCRAGRESISRNGTSR